MVLIAIGYNKSLQLAFYTMYNALPKKFCYEIHKLGKTSSLAAV